jgi:hypothetical protein
MLNPPKTREEAEKRRYGKWKVAWTPSSCAYDVRGGRYFNQCLRKPGHGPDGLYCKQHAKKVEA